MFIQLAVKTIFGSVLWTQCCKIVMVHCSTFFSVSFSKKPTVSNKKISKISEIFFTDSSSYSKIQTKSS